MKLGLTAQSQSPLRPAYLALHLTNTLLLLAALTLTAHLLSRRHGYMRGSIRLVAPLGAVVGVIVVMIVGVTGSLAALGDTLFPPPRWARPWRRTFQDQRLAGALALDASHRCISGQHLPYLVAGARSPAYAHWDNRGLSALVLLLLAAQYVLGVLDVFLLAPVWLQVAHLLGADALWIALVVLTARLTLQPVDATGSI